MSNQIEKRSLNQDLGERNEENKVILNNYNFRKVKGIKYKGYVDFEKEANNIRIMSINVNGLRLK